MSENNYLKITSQFGQVRPKGPKTAKWVTLKGDGSLDALFLMNREENKKIF